MSVDNVQTNWRHKFRGIVLKFGQFGAAIAAAATGLLMLHIVVDVIGRFVFNKPLPGTLEIVTYWWMPLIAFPALALAQARKEHIGVDALQNLMTEEHRKIAVRIAQIISLAIVAAIVVKGWDYALVQFSRGESTRGAVNVIIWPLRFLVPFGFGVYALQLLVDLIFPIPPRGDTHEEEAS